MSHECDGVWNVPWPHHAHEGESLREICRARPTVASAFWRTTLIDAANFREWVASIGSRQAYSRIAHLFCEMFVRLRAVGLAKGFTCQLPLTQIEIADAIGLSTMHVNRTIQELRTEALITFDGQSLEILDWPRLQDEGHFDSAYLHLKRQLLTAE